MAAGALTGTKSATAESACETCAANRKHQSRSMFPRGARHIRNALQNIFCCDTSAGFAPTSSIAHL
jgi:hypothetical protein